MAPVFPLRVRDRRARVDQRARLPLENMLYLFVLLALWDPWHFLMQHYGFTRIYDRHNAAPTKLAARMDLVLSAAWFVFIMLASGEWLVGMLEDLFTTAAGAAGAGIAAGVLSGLRARGARCRELATAATLALIYVVWCRRRGYFVSVAKLALFVDHVRRDVPRLHAECVDRSMGPGLDVPRGLRRDRHRAHDAVPRDRVALQPQSRGAARPRARWLLPQAPRARRPGSIGGAYVSLCLVYGGAHHAGQPDNRWLMSVLLALGFTSTLAALLLRRLHLEAAPEAEPREPCDPGARERAQRGRDGRSRTALRARDAAAPCAVLRCAAHGAERRRVRRASTGPARTM